MNRDYIAEGKHSAELARKKLELDNAPIKDLFGLLGSQGIFVVRMPIGDPDLSGVFYFEKNKNRASILVNSDRSPGHQNFTAAHEYCHYLYDKEENPVIFEEGARKSYIEKRADQFAANLLMPEDGVKYFVEDVLRIKIKRLDNEQIAQIRNEYGTSWKTTLYRLNNLGYSFDCAVELKIKDTGNLNFASLSLGLEQEINNHTNKLRLPSDYIRMVFKAFYAEKISMGRLAELLRVSQEEAKDILQGMDEAREDDRPNI